MQDMENRVLCHIAGPSGSGKSTLLEKIAALFPNIVCKDLDDFDDDGSKMLGLGALKKKDWRDEQLKELADIRQKLLNDFLKSQSGKKIILAGFHTEDEHELNIPTENKFLLDVSAEASARRAYERSQQAEAEHRQILEELPGKIKEAQEEIDARLKDGYVVKSNEEILEWISNKLL